MNIKDIAEDIAAEFFQDDYEVKGDSVFIPGLDYYFEDADHKWEDDDLFWDVRNAMRDVGVHDKYHYYYNLEKDGTLVITIEF